MEASLATTGVPRFARGVRLRHDEARGQWVLLAPERVLQPDGVAVEILKRVDGARTLDGIVDDLAATFAADRNQIAADVSAFLGDLMEKGMLEMRP
ncbi:pyrroloquinoline quinone biosynthesis peptide chaperone PqqD [Ancylobacter terrae]|uniref:pyrroloquinoline quinone biosynthesis peptide chaperone PqqD n=1 Tax=Ancylobacter sp. sgz301288 TaxID=3342077 RepID=UPI00385FC550